MHELSKVAYLYKMLPNSISSKNIQKHERRVLSNVFKSFQINLQKKAKQDLEKNSIVNCDQS